SRSVRAPGGPHGAGRGAGARAHAHLARRMALDGRHRETDRPDVPAGSHSRLRAVDRAAAAETRSDRRRSPGAIGAGSGRWTAAAVKPKRRQAEASRKNVTQRRLAKTFSLDASA